MVLRVLICVVSIAAHAVAAFTLCVPSAVAAQGEAVLQRRERVTAVMGTSLEIKVLGPDAAALESALAAAEAELRRVEDLMTTWRASPLMELNASAGSGPHATDPEIVRLLARSAEVSRLSQGAFDMTYAAVGRLWDFKAVPPLVPEAAAIAAALEHVDWERVRLDLDASTVELPAGASVDLGGIAKGYGVDRAMAVLMEHGVRHAIVNAGGDLKALGRNGDSVWEIAIKHPRDRGRVIAVLPLSNVAVTTSGDYERFFEHEGVRYHHILDPRTGRPSTGCMSATVVAPDAAAADALATALCVLSPAEGLELIEGLPRVEALLVDQEGRVHLSTGLESAAPAEAMPQAGD